MTLLLQRDVKNLVIYVLKRGFLNSRGKSQHYYIRVVALLSGQKVHSSSLREKGQRKNYKELMFLAKTGCNIKFGQKCSMHSRFSFSRSLPTFIFQNQVNRTLFLKRKSFEINILLIYSRNLFLGQLHSLSSLEPFEKKITCYVSSNQYQHQSMYENKGKE